MHIKNKAFIAVFSWFLPLVSILTHILVSIIQILTNNNITLSWDIITILDSILMTVISFVVIMLLRKRFNNKNLQYGIIIFAVVNLICGVAVYKQPVSLQATFYQTVNFLSNVILSNFLFVLEEEKPYMLLLTITSFLIHSTLNYLVTRLESN